METCVSSVSVVPNNLSIHLKKSIAYSLFSKARFFLKKVSTIRWSHLLVSSTRKSFSFFFISWARGHDEVVLDVASRDHGNHWENHILGIFSQKIIFFRRILLSLVYAAPNTLQSECRSNYEDTPKQTISNIEAKSSEVRLLLIPSCHLASTWRRWLHLLL